MAETIGEHNIQQYLTAFADGELDAAQILAVLDYLALHPQALQLMRTEQHLRLAAARAIRSATPSTPVGLRERLEKIVPTSTPWFRRYNWRLPAVAATFLLVGLFVGRAPWSLPADRPQPDIAAARPNEPIPATIVVHAMRIHADCSRLQEGLHTAGYPKEQKGLADDVARDLGNNQPYPDLSKLGFRYIGAGPCDKPLDNTIHLLYRSIAGDKHAVSVFVQPYQRQFDIDPGKLYLVSGPRSPFPMYAWRTQQVVYYLIADDEPAIQKARLEIASAPQAG